VHNLLGHNYKLKACEIHETPLKDSSLRRLLRPHRKSRGYSSWWMDVSFM